MQDKLAKYGTFTAITITLLFVASSCIVLPFVYYGNVETLTITVNHKERTTSSDGKTVSSYYLIYTDRETFALKDDLFYGQFNSSDVYGRIKSGGTYRVTALGVRVPLLSWYRNLVSVEEVE